LLGDQMEEVLMAVTFNNSVFDANQSQVGVTALGLFAGSDALSGTTPVTVNGTIDQPGSTVALTLNVAGVTQTGVPGTYIGYTTDQNSNVVYYFNADVANVQVPVVTVAVTGSPVLPTLGATPINTTATAAPVCFAAGTQILTPRGEVTVETLEIGDEVVTASGAHRPITWIGHRNMALERQSAAQPIRIKAGAVAPGVPNADLLVSPGHRLLIDDVLVCASDLVNGSSILREQVATVSYWHVELETHDVLIAQGMPSESYLEAANRAAFDNGDVVFGNRPHVALTASRPLCAPLLDGGPQLEAIVARLRDRAVVLGAPDTTDPSIQLIADGVVLTPVAVNEWQFDYVVPEGACSLVLRSRSAVPQETQPGSTDQRTLGVCVHKLVIDGCAVPLTDPRLSYGWNEAEADGAFRWTKGEADLPAARRLTIRATPLLAYAVAMAPVRLNIAA
jgi:hypothetical protein